MKVNTKQIKATNTAVETDYLKPLVVRASDCYKLMTNPAKKSSTLSQTTKAWLKEEAVAQVLGIKKTVLTKAIVKGVVCEFDSINLFNKVMDTNYHPSFETREQHGFRGTPDLIGNDCIIEIKTSWSASTFPFFQEDVEKQVKKAGHHWQCRVYMMLFGISRAVVSYCLVDTPNSDLYLTPFDTTDMHRFEGIVDHQKRVSLSQVIERDKAIEQQMLQRYEIANHYYQNYLKEIYNK